MSRVNAHTKFVIAFDFTVAGLDFREMLIQLSHGDALWAVLFAIMATALFAIGVSMMNEL